MSERSPQQTISEDLDTIVANDLNEKARNQGMSEWAAQKDEWTSLNELSTPKTAESTSVFSKDELANARTELSSIENLDTLNDSELINYLDKYTAGEKMDPIVNTSEKDNNPQPKEIAIALAEFRNASEEAVLVEDPSQPNVKIRLRDRIAGLGTNAAFSAGRLAKRNWEKLPVKLRRATMLGAGAAFAAGIVSVYGSRYGLRVGPFSPDAVSAATTTQSSGNLLDQSPQFKLPDLTATDITSQNPSSGTGAGGQFKQALHENHTGNKMISKGVTHELNDAKRGKLTGKNLEIFREDITTKTAHRGEYLANARFKMLEGNDASSYVGGIDKISKMTDHYLDTQGTHLSKSGERAYEHFSKFVEHAKIEKVSAQEAMSRGFNVNAGIMEGDLKRGLDDKTVVGGGFDKDVYLITGKNTKGQTIQLAVKEDCYNLLSKAPYVPQTPSTPNIPYTPSRPNIPYTPGTPSHPGTPSEFVPGKPGGPTPSIPDRPTPSTPTTPNTPETPTTPTPEGPTPKGEVTVDSQGPASTGGVTATGPGAPEAHQPAGGATAAAASGSGAGGSTATAEGATTSPDRPSQVAGASTGAGGQTSSGTVGE